MCILCLLIGLVADYAYLERADAKTDDRLPRVIATQAISFSSTGESVTVHADIPYQSMNCSVVELEAIPAYLDKPDTNHTDP